MVLQAVKDSKAEILRLRKELDKYKAVAAAASGNPDQVTFLDDMSYASAEMT